MTESITRIRGTGLPGSSPFGIMLPLLQIRPISLSLSPSAPLSLSLFPCLSFFLSLFRPALLCLLSFSSPLFAFHALPSSFLKLIHPLSSSLPFASPPRMHLKALRFYRVVDPSPSPTYPYPSAYYVIRITIICSETVSTAHQSE